MLTLHNTGMIDIWWLIWAIFIVAIIERKNLLDDSKKWFDLFRVLFELVSAFGGIGLSLGFPSVCIRPFLGYQYSFVAVFAQDNFSFSGAMHPLSKLVIIVIM
jgi:Trk-type K+ transport system membrane component